MNFITFFFSQKKKTILKLLERFKNRFKKSYIHIRINLNLVTSGSTKFEFRDACIYTWSPQNLKLDFFS